METPAKRLEFVPPTKNKKSQPVVTYSSLVSKGLSWSVV